MKWLLEHIWWILTGLVMVAGAVLALLAFQKNRKSLGDVFAWLGMERKVISAKAKARKATAKVGHTEAANQIKKDHQEAIDKMDEADKKKVEELSNDPEALISHLMHIS